MNNEIMKGFYEARKFAWDAKVQQLELIKKEHKYLIDSQQHKSFNKEFRTLQLDFGRRTGNTTFLKIKCAELSLAGNKSSFCFFLNWQILCMFWKRLEESLGRKLTKDATNIYTYTFETMKNGCKYIPNSYAFVDISCMLGEEKLDKIMQSDQWEIISLL